jgi:hypothetical protein
VSTLKVVLYVSGGVLEIVGIFLVAAPDLAPFARAAREGAIRGGRRALDRLRALVRRPRHRVVHVADAGGAVAMGGSVSALLSVSPDASDEEKFAYLVERARDSQRRLNELEKRHGEQAAEFNRRLEASREATEKHVSGEIRRALDVHRPLRLVGIGFLVLGALLLNAGNFA